MTPGPTMRTGARSLARAALMVALALGAGCGSGLPGGPQRGFETLDSVPTPIGTGGVVAVAWKRRVVPPGVGPAQPVERARPALDPERGRLYVASSAGDLLAFDLRGRKLYAVHLQSPVEAPLLLAPGGEPLLVPCLDGTVRALDPETGEERWRAAIGGPVRADPVLHERTLYVVTEEDEVAALSVRDGAVLWRFRRSRPEGFVAAGHASVALAGHRLLTGFTDGTVVALDRRDGTLLWERDTSLALQDLSEDGVVLTDVDATPVVRDGRVYAASYAAGLFVLDLESGSELRRLADWTSVTALADAGRCLLVASAERGVACLAWETLAPRWRLRVRRGAPVAVHVAGRHVVVAESEGALLVLDRASGRVRGGLPTDFGFTQRPAFAAGRLAAVLSDAGYLYVLRVAR